MFTRIAALTIVTAVVWSLAAVGTPASARPAPCRGSWSLGVGGFTFGLSTGGRQDSRYMVADEHVEYNTFQPKSGVREVNRLFWAHRRACPDDHIKLIGHSEGAAVVHAWVSAHQRVANADAVLIADPKRAAGPGGPGLAATIITFLVGEPLVGTDANFGAFPVLSVCNRDDVVCNINAGWSGYLIRNAHGAYHLDAAHYPDNASGTWYR
ncbi:cutinase family protein [Nocardia sp. CDC159]|uniref:Cutinase family protein n=1 Tax=Nocardia pulmonis TaxID=2951408 RepID=A0A9X2EDA7_9NOCA|nr:MULTISPECIES: cutinase family protein [Nocardia]MCM6778236.1 cutinase family protein [Nocardia pulmonis]MCM6791125.1 cutinase family protein [Nocardia sp. CDC159]